MSDYPRTLKGGTRKALHRIRAEKALGRPLPPRAVVHHADGSRNPDAPLVICENHAYHMLLHARMRVRVAGGDPNTQAICAMCKELRGLDSFYPDAKRYIGRNGNCRDCLAEYARDRWRKKHAGYVARAPYATARRKAAA